jgi:flagellar basal-body rod modification protein FlgD
MATTSSINSASNIQADYMKLLITQLQHQDPLQPMDNNQMASQLTMFSQLQQLESMNSSFTQALDSVQRSYANSLLGKQVSFADSETSSGSSSGTVQQVYSGTDGQLMLTVGNQAVALEDILSVQNPSTSTTTD